MELPFADFVDEPELWDEAVVEQAILKTLSKAEHKRQQRIYELVQTEKGFLRHLSILQKASPAHLSVGGRLSRCPPLNVFSPCAQVFRQRLLEARAVDANTLYSLFCNVDQLIVCNEPLAKALARRQKVWRLSTPCPPTALCPPPPALNLPLRRGGPSPCCFSTNAGGMRARGGEHWRCVSEPLCKLGRGGLRHLLLQPEESLPSL